MFYLLSLRLHFKDILLEKFNKSGGSSSEMLRSVENTVCTLLFLQAKVLTWREAESVSAIRSVRKF